MQKIPGMRSGFGECRWCFDNSDRDGGTCSTCQEKLDEYTRTAVQRIYVAAMDAVHDIERDECRGFMDYTEFLSKTAKELGVPSAIVDKWQAGRIMK
jgi:hypothetical protein